MTTLSDVGTTQDAPTTTSLLERFAPLLEHIASGAVHRESARTLAYDAVARLAQAGFTSVRIPREHGGPGASLAQTLRLLRELAIADPNLVQALRAHFTAVEVLLSGPDSERRGRWLKRIADGAILGNATTEKGNAPGTNSTHLLDRNGQLVLTGTKYYSTGSLYADWIQVHADTVDGRSVRATVRRDAPGVEVLDDWDGFGQRLTASGTARFDDVAVDPQDVIEAPRGGPGFTAAYVQAILLVALGGIAAAARRDTVDYVRGRTRAFAHGVGESASRDPLVQEVVGRISSSVFAIDAVLDAIGERIQQAAARQAAGGLDATETQELDASVSEAQVFVVEQTLDVTNRLFEVGGASAVSQGRGLDRHWRNARVLGQHNPVIYRAREIGQHQLTGDQRTTAIYVGAAGAQVPATTPGDPA
ncbi:acyl-CoA dehydrogenase family protein [Arthrobacter sp. JSM 101049]|uniref:acyl-CoA dehydrogenase family protein n=1 Tax=Arthrobacter sp. JSM 101049 TaxID=929097 RepID=UPI00356168D8